MRQLALLLAMLAALQLTGEWAAAQTPSPAPAQLPAGLVVTVTTGHSVSYLAFNSNALAPVQ
jgi:hypothetical protein